MSKLICSQGSRNLPYIICEVMHAQWDWSWPCFKTNPAAFLIQTQLSVFTKETTKTGRSGSKQGLASLELGCQVTKHPWQFLETKRETLTIIFILQWKSIDLTHLNNLYSQCEPCDNTQESVSFRGRTNVCFCAQIISYENLLLIIIQDGKHK